MESPPGDKAGRRKAARLIPIRCISILFLLQYAHERNQITLFLGRAPRRRGGGPGRSRGPVQVVPHLDGRRADYGAAAAEKERIGRAPFQALDEALNLTVREA